MFDSMVMSRAKRELVRELIAFRMAPMYPGAKGQLHAEIDRLTVGQLAGTPECTIATIVETYAKLTASFVPYREAISRIEKHRATLGQGQAPEDPTLENYIGYRLALEYPGVPGLTPAIVSLCVARAQMAYGLDSEPYPPPGQVEVYRTQGKQPSTQCSNCSSAQATVILCRQWLNGELADEDFAEQLEVLLSQQPG